jgi:monoamine oxidase
VRVVVVGAGLAGLAAADALRREEVDVEVLEARDRVGGRVWSEPFAGGVAERGAEFVFPGDDAVRAAVERLGLRLAPKGTWYGEREPRGGAPVSGTELQAAVRQLGSATTGAAGGSVADALTPLGLSAAVREAIEARIEVSSAYPAAELDTTVLAETGASFGRFETETIDGGNSRLAEELAAPLGAAVRRRAPVQRIEWDEESVRIQAEGFSLEADHAVLAVPGPATAAIEFVPPLPERKARAFADLRYGQAAKLHVALRAPVPPSATLAVPDRFWCYTQLGPDERPAPFVTAFAGTSAALERLKVEEGPATWLAVLRARRPDLDVDSHQVLLTTWQDDPWARGAYSARSLRSPLAGEELARPLGPFAFAGEHTAGELHGLMDGALRSGLRAAEDVLRS